MKNLSQLASKLILAILLVALPLSYSEAKPKKIVKGITFDGEVVKGMPHGYGKLAIFNIMEIKGDFDKDKITNARMEYFGQEERFFPQSEIEKDTLSTNILEGDFTYSFTEKWKSITFEASSINLYGTKGVYLGKFVILSEAEEKDGHVFLQLPKTQYNDILLLVGHSPSEPYLTNYHYILGASFMIRLLTLGERADDLYSRTSTNTDVLKFSDNSTLEYSTDHGIYIAAGDTLCFHKREWAEYPYGLNEFRITDSEGNVYKCKSSGSTGKNALEMNIYYADGSKYSGDVITDFIEDYHVGLELYKKMKAFTKSSIKYYKGTYTDTRGATTEYIDGETKANHDARLLADAKAKEEAEQEAKRKDEQARIAAHNELVRKYGKTFAEAIENDHIMVGMTTEMLNKMTLDWSLYYDGGSKKIYIGEQNMLADAFIKTFGGRSKKAYVTVVNNKVQSIVYK